jgi:hypothetical protein
MLQCLRYVEDLKKKLEVDRRLRIKVSNIKKRIRKTAEIETCVFFYDPAFFHRVFLLAG